jgi:hypothetical protein
MYDKMKNCCECNIKQDLILFSKDKNTKDGYNNRCKTCCALRNKKRYELKKETIKDKSIQYYYSNKESILSKQKSKPNSYQKNKEWHINYREKNKVDYLNYIKNYQKTTQLAKYHNDPVYRTKKIIGNQIRQFLKGHKNKKTELLLGYTYLNFIEKIGIPKKDEHIDHKIPITWFKDNTPVNIVWNLYNLQIVNKTYNKTKLNTFNDIVDLDYLNKIKDYIKEEYQTKLKKY